MKIDLKGFQEVAVTKLLSLAHRAKREASEGELQAVVLSSPTGSGKTVILTALLERLIRGDATHKADPHATFLWLSDSPQLNEQSRKKVEVFSDQFKARVVTIDNEFVSPLLEPGKLYFLNTQKLSKDSLLTKGADIRQHTVWQAIERTARERPMSFFVVIDEAHRGMAENARARNQAETIIQRFIKGEPSVGLSPIPLIIGMSATPERFEKVLEGPVGRTKRPWTIPVQDVMGSGLIKDRILVYFPDRTTNTDWALLGAAAARWQAMKRDWEGYCKTETEEIVKPILLVQVKDGRGDQLTQTNLETAVHVISRQVGHLPQDAFAHAFDYEGDVQAGDVRIRCLEPSAIQDDKKVRVVFFKTALATGWDCPRAEVMMSFRPAQDATYIAQLVGRMLRNPLARRIDSNDTLNSVSLYLPYFDRPTINGILERLRHPDQEEGLNIEVAEGVKMARYSVNPALPAALEILRGLPTVSITRGVSLPPHHRFLRFARLLSVHDKLDPSAYEHAKQRVVSVLVSEAKRLSKTPAFKRQLASGREIEVREMAVDAGVWKPVGDERTLSLSPTPENIQALFDECERYLGEGIKDVYWRKRSTKTDPDTAKLELHTIISSPAVWDTLNAVSSHHMDVLYEKHKAKISALPEGPKSRYRQLRRTSGHTVLEDLALPAEIEVQSESVVWKKHLYSDSKGEFRWDANGWEAPVLAEELARRDIVGWLRNYPKKEWSLAVPYGVGAKRPFYPDLLIVRKKAKQLVVDIIDPHNPELSDAWEKASGLASYAAEHEDRFGRIEIVYVDDGVIRRIDLTKEAVRREILEIRSNDALITLYKQIGYC